MILRIGIVALLDLLSAVVTVVIGILRAVGIGVGAVVLAASVITVVILVAVCTGADGILTSVITGVILGVILVHTVVLSASVITGVIVVAVLAGTDRLGTSVVTLVILVGILMHTVVHTASVVARMVLVIVLMAAGRNHIAGVGLRTVTGIRGIAVRLTGGIGHNRLIIVVGDIFLTADITIVILVGGHVGAIFQNRLTTVITYVIVVLCAVGVGALVHIASVVTRMVLVIVLVAESGNLILRNQHRIAYIAVRALCLALSGTGRSYRLIGNDRMAGSTDDKAVQEILIRVEVLTAHITVVVTLGTVRRAGSGNFRNPFAVGVALRRHRFGVGVRRVILTGECLDTRLGTGSGGGDHAFIVGMILGRNDKTAKRILIGIEVSTTRITVVVSLGTLRRTGSGNFRDPCAVGMSLSRHRLGIGMTFIILTGERLDTRRGTGGILCNLANVIMAHCRNNKGIQNVLVAVKITITYGTMVMSLHARIVASGGNLGDPHPVCMIYDGNDLLRYGDVTARGTLLVRRKTRCSTCGGFARDGFIYMIILGAQRFRTCITYVVFILVLMSGSRQSIRIHMLAIPAGVSSQTACLTSGRGINIFGDVCMETLFHNVSACILRCLIFRSQIFADIGGIGTAVNGSHILGRKYVTGGILGIVAGNRKVTAIHRQCALKSIHIAVNGLKCTAVDDGSSPGADKIIIFQSLELTVIDHQRSRFRYAETIDVLKVELAALDGELSVHHQCVVFLIEILNIQFLSGQIPGDIFLDDDLSQCHDGIAGLSSLHGSLQGFVTVITDLRGPCISTAVCTYCTQFRKCVSRCGRDPGILCDLLNRICIGVVLAAHRTGIVCIVTVGGTVSENLGCKVQRILTMSNRLRAIITGVLAAGRFVGSHVHLAASAIALVILRIHIDVSEGFARSGAAICTGSRSRTGGLAVGVNAHVGSAAIITVVIAISRSIRMRLCGKYRVVGDRLGYRGKGCHHFSVRTGSPAGKGVVIICIMRLGRCFTVKRRSRFVGKSLVLLGYRTVHIPVNRVGQCIAADALSFHMVVGFALLCQSLAARIIFRVGITVILIGELARYVVAGVLVAVGFTANGTLPRLLTGCRTA